VRVRVNNAMIRM